MTESSESNLVVAAAERYRSSGYDIVFQPSKSLLPEPVRSFRPDFIANQGEEHIAVEVKSRSALRNDEEIRRYAELFRGLPGWRLDLVIIPDEPAQLPEPKLLSRESLRKRLKAADALVSDHRDLGGAIILLWTAIEASLRADGDDSDRLPVMTGSKLVKEALSTGIISQEEWEELDRLVRLRNQIAHGEAPRITKALYKSVRTIASRLIDYGP